VKRFLRMLAGFALLPAAAGCAMALVDAVGAMPVPEDSIFPRGVVALLGGMAAFVALWTVFPRPVRAYVLGHELTHAAWAILFGARVGALKVRENGGSVELSKSNLLITLAPYFFPFYTVLVFLAAVAVRLWAGRLPCPPAWMFAVGFTWCFHFCFTVQSLMQRQPDILEYGRVFSWTVVFIVNAAGVLAWITATAPLPAGESAKALARRVADSYRVVCSAARSCAAGVAERARGR